MTLYEIIIDDCPTYFDAHGRQWTLAQLVTGSAMWFCDEGNKRPVDARAVNIYRFPPGKAAPQAAAGAQWAVVNPTPPPVAQPAAQSHPESFGNSHRPRTLPRWRELLSLAILRILFLLIGPSA